MRQSMRYQVDVLSFVAGSDPVLEGRDLDRR